MKYLLEQDVQGTMGEQKYKSTIRWRNGVLIADEPEKIGGRDSGPDPHTLLLSSLVACVLATLRMYIDHKKLDIPEITVRANMGQRINAGTGEITTRIERSVSFGDTHLTPEIRTRLLEIAESCPISKILKGNIVITVPSE